MKDVIIHTGERSPKVTFKPEQKIFEIIGNSSPENANLFYEPLIEWVEEYLEELKVKKLKEPLEFKFFLEYFNSTSSKYLLTLIKVLSQYIKFDIPVMVTWCYDDDSEDVKEMGEEFESIIPIPFQFVKCDSME